MSNKEKVMEMIDRLSETKTIKPVKEILKILAEDVYINNRNKSSDELDKVFKSRNVERSKARVVENNKATPIKPIKDVFISDDYPTMIF